MSSSDSSTFSFTSLPEVQCLSQAWAFIASVHVELMLFFFVFDCVFRFIWEHLAAAATIEHLTSKPRLRKRVMKVCDVVSFTGKNLQDAKRCRRVKEEGEA